MEKKVKIGTRGSQLALIQADMVIEQLAKNYPDMIFEKVILTTKGDRIIDKPLVEFGGKGVFIEEFERALHKGEIDIAVHSGKDLPIELGDGLMIGGVLEREDPRDVLVVKKGASLSHKVCIGTGSLRRKLFAKQIWDCTVVGMRGNVTTRLEKMKSGACDGVVLAAAGLKRLKLEQEPEYDYYYLSVDECIPAGCQGIIVAECRQEDREIREMLQTVHHKKTGILFEIEREVLHLLQADCRQMAAVYSCFQEESCVDMITLSIAYEKNGCYYRTVCHDSMENSHSLAKSAVAKLEDSPWYI